MENIVINYIILYVTGLISKSKIKQNKLLLGALIVNIYLKDEQKVNKTLKITINNLEDALDLANSRVENRDNLIKDLQEEAAILLNNSMEDRSKIVDLENNVEFLFNNLSKQKKELVSDYHSQN